ncbi:restriction endonuclease subunit S [Bacillus velezensis]|uniref:restriction endonuclease subunit S n=1 Tax=Bacillus velezensis TaxID=492670 RepID=UPI002FBE5DA4
MSDKITKSPQIRFAGFADAWEQHKLGNITERVARKNKNLDSTLPLTISAQFGLVDQETFFNKVVASKDVSGYYLIKKGEFAYNKSYSKDYPWGAVKRLEKYDMGVLSTLYITFTPTNVNSDFLVHYYDTNGWHKEVALRAAEGARNHGLLNITASDFFDTVLSIPVSKEEQKKIGIFFKQLDETITLHQRKLELLKDTKKSLLQKMFPKDGANVPEIRFVGFTDAWEQRELGELAPLRGGFAFKSDEFKEDGIPIVRISNILRSGEVGGDFTYYPEQEKDDNYLLPNRSVVLAMSGATTGKVSILCNPDGGKVYQNQRVGYFTKTDIADYGFVSTITRSQMFIKQLSAVLVAGAQPNISSKDIDTMTFYVPTNLEEQTKIGILFEKLDDLFTLHQRQLNLLKDLKKSLLQQMFI